jgi:hypothetical protein
MFAVQVSALGCASRLGFEDAEQTADPAMRLNFGLLFVACAKSMKSG